MKKRNVLFFALSALLFNTNNINAEVTGYVGANSYVNFWKVGFLDNRTVKTEGSTAQLGRAFFIFPVFNGTATLILNRKWTSTYSFSYAKPSGDADITVSPSVRDCNGTPCQLISGDVTDKFNPNLKGTRMDHDLSFGRALGRTGWTLFSGVKYQTFSINLDETAGTRTNNFTGTILPSGPTFTTNNSIASYLALNYNTQALGPSIGAGYTRELTSWLYINVQLSYLALFGNATIEFKSRGATDNGTTFTSERTAYIGHGGATALALVFPVGERLLVQVAYRLQAYVTKVTNTTSQTRDGYGFQVDQSTNKNPSYIDNAVDLYQGISLGVQYRVF